MIGLSLRELRAAPAQHLATLIVTVVGALLATAVVETDRILGSQSVAGGFTQHGFVRLLLDVLGSVFLFVAVFVSCIVVANTFGIVMVSRARRIALLRLLGAEARHLRRAVVVEGLIVGVIGGAIGTVLGVVAAALAVQVLTTAGIFSPAPSPLGTPLLVVPIAISAVSTAGAAWLGSGKVTTVTPLEAVGASQSASFDDVRRRRLSPAIGCIVVGAAVMASGVGVGLVTPFGLFLAAPGGALSFLGIILGSDRFLPPLLRAVGRMFGTTPSSRLARGNTMRQPERSARSTIGLVIGVTLVTMFAVAAACFQRQAGAVAATAGPQEAASDQQFVALVLGVLGVLISFSLLIASVGLVNSLTLGVLQRRREIGLLRAVGLDRGGVRRMVLVESMQLAVVGGLGGLLLGVVYGWAAAVTALASDHHIGGYFLPTVPLTLVAAVLGGAALLAVIASLVPARRALAVSPIEALAFE